MNPLHDAELTPVRAFVVQLRVGTPLVAEQAQGRIEHVASGRASDFASLGQAFEFMREVLAGLPNDVDSREASEFLHDPGHDCR